MTATALFLAGGAALFAVGLYGVLVAQPLLRRILAANIMGNGVFMVLIATAHAPRGAHDAVAHALVLTGIVVAVSATALGLKLVCRLHELETGPARERDP